MCALSGACIRFYTLLYFSFSLIIDTQKVPIMSIAPAAIIMWLCTLPSRCSMVPPKAAAMIWGTQMVPLNRPRYAPMCPFPSKALVTKVKGMANVAAQAQPMRMKGTNIRYLSVM